MVATRSDCVSSASDGDRAAVVRDWGWGEDRDWRKARKGCFNDGKKRGRNDEAVQKKETASLKPDQPRKTSDSPPPQTTSPSPSFVWEREAQVDPTAAPPASSSNRSNLRRLASFFGPGCREDPRRRRSDSHLKPRLAAPELEMWYRRRTRQPFAGNNSSTMAPVNCNGMG